MLALLRLFVYFQSCYIHVADFAYFSDLDWGVFYFRV